MAAVMEKAWTAPAGTRWSFPLFGGHVCFVRGTDEAELEPSDELDETPNAALRESFEEGRRIMSGEQPVKWKAPQELFAEWDSLYARNH